MSRNALIGQILGHRGSVGRVGAAMLKAAAPVGAQMGVKRVAWSD